MANNVNVSVEAINDGIDFLEQEFLNPVLKRGENTIMEYEHLNQNLKSVEIDRIIADQKNRLEECKTEFQRIIAEARDAMGVSAQVVQANTEETEANLV